MSWLGDIVKGTRYQTLQSVEPAHRFAAVPTPVVAPIGSDFQTWQTLMQISGAGMGMVSRAEILAVPGFVRARDVFCSLGSLPLQARNGDGVKVPRKLLDQPESTIGRVRSVTMSRTIEDLLFDAASLWIVTDRDSTQYPTAVRHVPIQQWSQDSNGLIRVGGEVIPAGDVIMFESSNLPLRRTARETVLTARLLGATANNYAAHPERNGYFTQDRVDATDEEIQQFLLDFHAGFQNNGPQAMLPEGVGYVDMKRMTSDELQLIQAREWCVSEACRLTGLNPNWNMLNITTRVYSNMQDERRDFVDFVGAPFLRTIEERLSMGDVTPGTQAVKWNLNAFLRGNTLERYQTYQLGLDGGWLTLDEVRDLEDLPALPEQDQAPTPANPPTPEEGTNG